MGESDTKVCPRCGGTFTRTPGSRLGNWRRRTFCSSACGLGGGIDLPPNVTYRQFDYWCSKGYVQLQGEANPGNGHRRKLSAGEARVLRILADLASDGVAPATAARVARELVYVGQASLGRITITHRGPWAPGGY